jgi:hypothetical protein
MTSRIRKVSREEKQVKPVFVRRPLGDDSPTATLYYGVHVIDGLRHLSDGAVQCVVTSPPYW